jgi:hypothetical protein
MLNLTCQLEMLGLDEAKRRATAEEATPAERRRLLRRVEVTHESMSELPSPDNLSFLHSGLCQTCLPHSRPVENHAIWRRRSGRFSCWSNRASSTLARVNRNMSVFPTALTAR